MSVNRLRNVNIDESQAMPLGERGERNATAYQVASDLYVQMVLDMASARKSTGRSPYVDLPDGEQQHRHILQIAEFLTCEPPTAPEAEQR
jgi:hypothetical protein